MFEIEAGERRTLVEEDLGRNYNLVLKKEEEIPGGVRCFYGYTRDKQGFLEVIYLDDIVLDSKIHEDIVSTQADEKLQKLLDNIADKGENKEEVESFLKKRFFYNKVGTVIQTKSGYLQKYGTDFKGKVYVDIHITYDENDQVLEAKVVPEEIASVDE